MTPYSEYIDEYSTLNWTPACLIKGYPNISKDTNQSDVNKCGIVLIRTNTIFKLICINKSLIEDSLIVLDDG